MTWLSASAGALIVVFCVLVWALWRPLDPYDPRLRPGDAPERGTFGRILWRLRARRGPRPGPPL